MADVPDPDVAPAASPTVGSDAGGGPVNDVLELYKVAVEMADRVSARRALANTFFLSVNSALLVVAGLVPHGTTREAVTPDRFGIVVVVAAGLLLSLTWWTLLRSYRQLNEAKFHVINAMEQGLPAAPFSSEWQYLRSKRSSRAWQRYFELGQAERVVPLVYAAVYVVVGVRAVVT